MKKLIIACVSGLMAIGTYAATVSWTATSGYLWDGAETPAKVTSGTAYLVLASYSQGDLVSAYAAADGNAAATLTTLQGKSEYLGSGTIGSNARIADGTGTTSASASISTYFVVFNDDKMYISDVAASDYDALMGEHTIMFSSLTSSSKAAALDASSGYSAAGWYTAVPEPTSGLLMLLGMAGLALKRKRA